MIGKVISHGLTAWNYIDPVLTYRSSRKEGKGVVNSAAYALGTFAAWELAAPLMWGLLAKDVAVGVGKAVMANGKENAKLMNNAYSSSFGGFHVDTQNAYTMRQRGVQAIQKTGMNVRNVLGSEARHYLRGV